MGLDGTLLALFFQLWTPLSLSERYSKLNVNLREKWKESPALTGYIYQSRNSSLAPQRYVTNLTLVINLLCFALPVNWDSCFVINNILIIVYKKTLQYNQSKAQSLIIQIFAGYMIYLLIGAGFFIWFESKNEDGQCEYSKQALTEKMQNFGNMYFYELRMNTKICGGVLKSIKDEMVISI